MLLHAYTSLLEPSYNFEALPSDGGMSLKPFPELVKTHQLPAPL